MSENIVVEEAPLEGDPITDFQEAAPQETQTEETQQPEFIIPEKYAGKSNEDLVEMHQNVEKMMSKQSNEVGEQRKLIQSLMDAQNKALETALPKEESVDFEQDFYSDPADAVNKAIENHPELIEARQERKISAQKQQVSVLEKAYPDWQTKIATSEFQKWVGESEIRTEMFKKADSEYRPDYAIELFDMYDKVNMIDKTKQVQQEETAKRDKALKATTTENRSTSDTLGGKKVYRRADLIQLQVSDPNRYEALQDEIYSAYQEGRVK
jgi:hypothetical protein|tara:strand:- start:732 stop:1535 length:804 start_codon:yes stop_codon:yes gene_type:complete